MTGTHSWLSEVLLTRAPAGKGRVLIVAAHPDDEVIGATSVIQSVPDLEILHTTNGSPKNETDARNAGCRSATEYAGLRRDELMEALRIAGRVGIRLHELPFMDQACSFELVALTHALRTKFEALKPGVIITHPYEGGHPDHDATAFAVHAAAAICSSARSRPLLVEMTSYHLGPGGIETGTFLQPSAIPFSEHLSRDACAKKRAMLACFNSQRETLQYFSDAVEQFRIAPAYDFLSAPHPGLLFYEKFNWGMTGSQWRQLARAALHQLHLAGAWNSAQTSRATPCR